MRQKCSVKVEESFVEESLSTTCAHGWESFIYKRHKREIVKSAYIESSFGLCTRHQYTCVGHIPDNRHAVVKDKGHLPADPTVCAYVYLLNLPYVPTPTWACVRLPGTCVRRPGEMTVVCGVC